MSIFVRAEFVVADGRDGELPELVRGLQGRVADEPGTLRYDWFQYRGRPLGSGAVESAIRRVINLRLKGNGIYWREENAEAMLVLRAAALTGRWQEMMERTHAAMARDRRRAWQWGAPDIVAELNSGVPIKPPTPQPEPSGRNETIAA